MHVASGLGWEKLDLHCSNLPLRWQQENHYPYQHLRAELWARICRLTLTGLPTLQPSGGPCSPAESLQLPFLHPFAMGSGCRCMPWSRTFQCLHHRLPGPHLAKDCASLTRQEKGKRKKKKQRRAKRGKIQKEGKGKWKEKIRNKNRKRKKEKREK